MTADERAVRDAHVAWIDDVNAGRLERLLERITDDVVMVGPGYAPLGRAEFAANYRTSQEQMQFHCTSEIEEVVVVGDVAYTRCRDTLSIAPRAGGDTTRFAGDRLTVYRRQPDGRWLLARDAHTLTAVGAAG